MIAALSVTTTALSSAVRFPLLSELAAGVLAAGVRGVAAPAEAGTAPRPSAWRLAGSAIVNGVVMASAGRLGSAFLSAFLLCVDMYHATKDSSVTGFAIASHAACACSSFVAMIRFSPVFCVWAGLQRGMVHKRKFEGIDGHPIR